MANIFQLIGDRFTWLWNGLAKFFDICRWFMTETKRLKGLFIATAIAAFKFSYDAVISGLNEMLEKFQNMQLSSEIQTSVSEFLEFANAVFPLSELLAMLVALLHLAVLALIIRAIRKIGIRIF